MRVLVTGGGTGGHVYPGLSVLDAFTPRPEVLWVGRQGGMEQGILEKAGVPYRAIRAGGLASMGWGARLRNMVLLSRGFGEAWNVIRKFRPDVVLATGGYVTFPVGVAARMQGIPLVVYLPDIKPGLTVRALAPLATKVAVTVPEGRKYFGSKTVVTGYPVRKELAQPKSKVLARQSFNLPTNANVLLVTGGSQGSHSLNQAVGNALAGLLAITHIIHVYGKVDGEWLQQQKAALPATLQAKYQLYDYLHDTMSDALLAADAVVARAGASVLGEFPAAALPAILVPLPIAGVQQSDNAQWLAERGAALIVQDREVSTALLPTVQKLFNDATQLTRMRSAMYSRARPDAARLIAELVQTVGAS